MIFSVRSHRLATAARRICGRHADRICRSNVSSPPTYVDYFRQATTSSQGTGLVLSASPCVSSYSSLTDRDGLVCPQPCNRAGARLAELLPASR